MGNHSQTSADVDARTTVGLETGAAFHPLHNHAVTVLLCAQQSALASKARQTVCIEGGVRGFTHFEPDVGMQGWPAQSAAVIP